ncbi:hypothetical protein [uncultured Maribacter sp.]|uniref:hypothetical protein n=1 Tax=uncultured Maribacter sp. TaxID=431308 RepID=UPI00262E6C1E|nr:hypothetical protein [uncultured Maribacter sp.]
MKPTTSEPKKVKQKISLIDGHFTTSEALDIINNVLNVKINFHKLQRLSLTEGNTLDECKYDSSRIGQLLKEQKIAKDFFKDVRLNGGKLRINSTIEITLEG